MSSEEISSFLSAGKIFIKPEESKAIMFLQHSTDSRGYPKRYAYDTIEEASGVPKAKIILSAVKALLLRIFKEISQYTKIFLEEVQQRTGKKPNFSQ